MSTPQPEPDPSARLTSHHIDFGEPVAPRDDDFWRPPADYEDAARGTVLRSREVRLAFLGVLPQKVVAYQLLYRTTDLHGEPQATVTTVISAGRNVNPTAPVVSYQCAIDSVASTGSPSYALRNKARIAKTFGGPPAWEYIFMACALWRGWRVVVPDHGGAQGSWTAPREPGYCVLDGIRAAMNFSPATISAEAPVALWGYSGGGLASGWAAELWQSYAPALNIVGAVLGAPVADPGEIFRDLDGTIFAGLPALALAGLLRAYPEMRRTVFAHTSAAGQELLTSLAGMSMIGAMARCFRRRSARHLDCSLDDILATPQMVAIFDDLRLGGAAPAMPLLAFQAIHDRIINVRHIDALIAAYRRQGSQVTYVRDRRSGHALLFPLSVPVALQWMSDRFTQGPPASEGDEETTLLIAPKVAAGLLGIMRVALTVVLGRPLGARR
jgi:hypothetical protein